MGEFTIEHLRELQALPLKLKIRMTQQRIREWVSEFGTDGVYVSFSGGKDSTVLLHIVRELYPDIPAVFCDTGLEYPEIRQFVKTWDNVVWLKPKKNFFQVCEEYGFPLISKEVSECIYGARKYLTSVLEQESLDRQTDRQTEHPYWHSRYRRLCGLGEYAKFSETPSEKIGGGNRDKLWQAHIDKLFARESHKYQYETDRVLGTVDLYKQLAKGDTVDKRLWKGYRQSASADHVGDSDRSRQSDDGDYP